MKHGLVAGFLISSVLILGACEEGSRGRTPQGQPSTDSTEACPGQSSAALMGETLSASRGDVDGDGSGDEVRIVLLPEGPPGCRHFLVADTGAGQLITPTNDPGVEHSLEEPRIATLVHVDDQGGLEILLDLERGAASQFLGLFTLVEGSLQRVTVEDPFAPGGLLPYGGSAGRLEVSDCAGRGDVSISVASADPEGYTVETRLFDMEAGRLRRLPPEAQPGPRMGVALETIDTFGSGPFASCSSSGAEGV
jgi:hypothetical protein